MCRASHVIIYGRAFLPETPHEDNHCHFNFTDYIKQIIDWYFLIELKYFIFKQSDNNTQYRLINKTKSNKKHYFYYNIIIM